MASRPQREPDDLDLGELLEDELAMPEPEPESQLELALPLAEDDVAELELAMPDLDLTSPELDLAMPEPEDESPGIELLLGGSAPEPAPEPALEDLPEEDDDTEVIEGRFAESESESESDESLQLDAPIGEDPGPPRPAEDVLALEAHDDDAQEADDSLQLPAPGVDPGPDAPATEAEPDPEEESLQLDAYEEAPTPDPWMATSPPPSPAEDTLDLAPLDEPVIDDAPPMDPLPPDDASDEVLPEVEAEPLPAAPVLRRPLDELFDEDDEAPTDVGARPFGAHLDPFDLPTDVDDLLADVALAPVRRRAQAPARPPSATTSPPVQAATPTAPRPVPALAPGWRRLHPLSPLINLGPRAWGVIRSIGWPLILLYVAGRTSTVDGYTWVSDLSILLVLFALSVANTFVHYLTLRYRMIDGRLEITSGLLDRTQRVIVPAKVQDVEIHRNLAHRVFGLSEVRIQTASGDEVEGLLSALSDADALALVHALAPQRAAPGPAAAPDRVVARNSPVDLLIYGATSTRFGAALAGLFVLFEVVGVGDPEQATQATRSFGALGLLAMFFLAAVATWGGGIVTAMIRHHDLALTRDRGVLTLEEGLFTRRRVQLQLRKVQVLTVQEPWQRRVLGFGTVTVETASARTGRGGTERQLAELPRVDREELDDVVREALPGADVPLGEARLRSPAPMALRRALVRGALRGALLAGLLTWWAWPWGALAWMLVPVGSLLGWLDWRTQGWTITDEVVVSRRGWLQRVTQVVARDKLQTVELVQGPFLRRLGLGEVVLRVAGTAVPMPLLAHDEAWALMGRLSRPAGRAPPAAP
ncbi:MAG: PH domain-containing protein [Alphaproteobacteria bacterium]|nr:PH domain-containing protein [Alphaproteobacteria bacterium]